MSNEEDVIVVLDIEGLKEQTALEKHLRREGLHAIDHEPFAYSGKTSTKKINTLLYLFDGVKKAIHKGGFLTCHMMVSIGEYPMEAYRYDRERHEFVLVG